VSSPTRGGEHRSKALLYATASFESCGRTGGGGGAEHLNSCLRKCCGYHLGHRPLAGIADLLDGLGARQEAQVPIMAGTKAEAPSVAVIVAVTVASAPARLSAAAGTPLGSPGTQGRDRMAFGDAAQGPTRWATSALAPVGWETSAIEWPDGVSPDEWAQGGIQGSRDLNGEFGLELSSWTR